MEKLPFIIRDAQQEDHAFLYNSYLKSYGTIFIRHSGGSDVVKPEVFMVAFHKLFTTLLHKRRVLIACPTDQPEIICGWAVGDTLSLGLVVLDWFYVKKDFRGMGIGKALYEELGGGPNAKVLFTHWTPRIKDYLKNRCAEFQYVPTFVLESWSK